MAKLICPSFPSGNPPSVQTIQKAIFEIFDDIKNGNYKGRTLQEIQDLRTANGGGLKMRTDELVFLMYNEGCINSDDDLKCLSQNLGKSQRRENKKTLIKSPSKISRCGFCNDPASLKCNQCKQVFYCNREHQKEHWAEHKTMCKK